MYVVSRDTTMVSTPLLGALSQRCRETRLACARAVVMQGKLDLAAKDLQQVLSKEPSNVEAMFMMANVHFLKQNYQG